MALVANRRGNGRCDYTAVGVYNRLERSVPIRKTCVRCLISLGLGLGLGRGYVGVGVDVGSDKIRLLGFTTLHDYLS